MNYILNIADYKIGFESVGNGPELTPGKRFLGSLSDDNNYDILIKVQNGNFTLPAGTSKVFDAPFVEEVNGIKTKKSSRFWSIHKNGKDLFIKSVFPLSSSKKKAVLKFSFTERIWQLWISGNQKKTDPMEYPLDGLILYYVSAIHGDIMIHASGVNMAGHGYLFSGMSGKGKTTIARLWDKAGARIIHDDRLIIRINGNRYLMYNTPVYNNDVPKVSVLDRIFLIEHGDKNEFFPLSGAVCVSMVMANCIQHNWDPGIIARLLGSVSLLCQAVPAGLLKFRPDRSIIDYIIENE